MGQIVLLKSIMALYNVLILAVKTTEAMSECHLLFALLSHQMLLQL